MTTHDGTLPATQPSLPGQAPEATGPPRRKPGAPPGNQNARKKSPFYFGDLPAEEQANINRVLGSRDLGPELVMLRMSLARLLADPATRPSDLASATRSLASILRTQARLTLAPPRLRSPRRPKALPAGDGVDAPKRHKPHHGQPNELQNNSKSTPAQAAPDNGNNASPS